MMAASLQFNLDSYSEPSRERINQAIRELAPKPPDRSLRDVGISLSLKEAWVRGGLDIVLARVDEVTRNTVEIGRSFLAKPAEDPSRMKRFYWLVEHPAPSARCALDIALCLVSFDPSKGEFLLTQQVLRIGADDFAYWGVD
jgi:hypothetical protein